MGKPLLLEFQIHTHTHSRSYKIETRFFKWVKYLLAEIGCCVAVCVCGVYLEIQIEIFEAWVMRWERGLETSFFFFYFIRS